MKLVFGLFVAIFSIAASAKANDVLGIKRGIYVRKGTSCESPATVDILGYWGNSLGIGHDGCSFKNLKLHGQTVRAIVTCSDVQTSQPIVNKMSFTVIDNENFVVGSKLTPNSKVDFDLYTYCRESL